jgi:pilus assembly protein Flp/PilA
MLKLIALVQAYAKKEDGATAIEYGLIAAGIALAIAAAVIAFGDTLTGVFTDMGTELENAAN